MRIGYYVTEGNQKKIQKYLFLQIVYIFIFR